MSDSTVRDHLANERTFLAWVRTSVSLMGFGVVIAKLRFLVVMGTGSQTLNPHGGARSTLLGLAFAIVGLLTLLFAFLHFNQTRQAIDANSFHASGRVILIFASLLFLLGLTAVGYLLTLTPA
jgi:putative membrane protein